MNRIVTAVVVGLLIFAAAGIALAQERPGSLRGQVLDELGGAIVGATVTAIDAKGTEKTVTTNNNGIYTINGLATIPAVPAPTRFPPQRKSAGPRARRLRFCSFRKLLR